TGYSSIQTITHVRPSYLKIDLSLVKDIQANLLKQELVSSLALLAKNIGALIIAEGVGTIGEMEVLKELGVPLAQGYLFGMPSRKFAETARPES
ncbi:MAG: diguanylate phosphodiesterase, partial [Acidobacteria bacterium 37-65-4]